MEFLLAKLAMWYTLYQQPMLVMYVRKHIIIPLKVQLDDLQRISHHSFCEAVTTCITNNFYNRKKTKNVVMVQNITVEWH